MAITRLYGFAFEPSSIGALISISFVFLVFFFLVFCRGENHVYLDFMCTNQR